MTYRRFERRSRRELLPTVPLVLYWGPLTLSYFVSGFLVPDDAPRWGRRFVTLTLIPGMLTSLILVLMVATGISHTRRTRWRQTD